MKTSKLFLSFAILSILFASCKPESETKTTVVDFEDVTLNSDSIWNGSDKSGILQNGTYYKSIFSGSIQLLNKFTPNDWGGLWSGFAVSSKTDTLTTGYLNQYSVIAGSGAFNSKNFAIAYDTAEIKIVSATEIKSIMVTNSTYTYLEMKNGGFGKKFTTGDWFKVKIKGYLGTQVKTIEYYLADFRNGKSFISKTWEKIDLSSLGNVERLIFTFDSSDKTGSWLNTPAYVCIDNLEMIQPTYPLGLN